MISVESVQAKLGENASLVTIEKVGDFIVVKPKEFIRDKAKWDEINSEVLKMGGKYVGGIGKNSHWKIPVASQPSKVDVVSRINGIIDELTRLRNELKEAS